MFKILIAFVLLHVYNIYIPTIVQLRLTYFPDVVFDEVMHLYLMFTLHLFSIGSIRAISYAFPELAA